MAQQQETPQDQAASDDGQSLADAINGAGSQDTAAELAAWS
jgi:hypothetical protein